MELRILKKLTPCILISSLIFNSAAKIDVLAAGENYPILYEDLSESELPVAVLTVDEIDYTVVSMPHGWTVGIMESGGDIALANVEISRQ